MFHHAVIVNNKWQTHLGNLQEQIKVQQKSQTFNLKTLQ